MSECNCWAKVRLLETIFGNKFDDVFAKLDALTRSPVCKTFMMDGDGDGWVDDFCSDLVASHSKPLVHSWIARPVGEEQREMYIADLESQYNKSHLEKQDHNKSRCANIDRLLCYLMSHWDQPDHGGKLLRDKCGEAVNVFLCLSVSVLVVDVGAACASYR